MTARIVKFHKILAKQVMHFWREVYVAEIGTLGISKDSSKLPEFCLGQLATLSTSQTVQIYADLPPQDPPGAGPFPVVHTSHFPEPEIEQLAQFPTQAAYNSMSLIILGQNKDKHCPEDVCCSVGFSFRSQISWILFLF